MKQPEKSDARILVVDDLEFVRERVVAILCQALEVQCLTATDGVDAMRTIRSCATLQVVVTDYRMPLCNGLELARQTSVTAPQLVLIMMSAEWNDALHAAARAVGINHHIEKSKLVNELADIVRSLLKL